MEFFNIRSLDEREGSDLLVLPFWQEDKRFVPAAQFDTLALSLRELIDLALFKASNGEVALVYHNGIEKRVALLGLGKKDEADAEMIRRAYGSLVRFCHKKKFVHIHLMLPTVAHDLVYAAAEGILLRNYLFHQKEVSVQKDPHVLLERVGVITSDTHVMPLFDKAQKVHIGVDLARDLVNGNADDITPQHLSQLAIEIGQRYPQIEVEVFDKTRIQKEGMGLLLAVNKGSHRDPAFIRIYYKGDPTNQEHTVIVGKGITYDTGGLNLKPTGSMETMKCDMSGAAAAFGAIVAAAELNLKANVTAIIPSTENAISSHAYKPGDVYKSYSGHTVEIDNTDAEGRLVLADALAWAEKQLYPTRMIDLATLTGAIVIALGDEATGMMSNNDELAAALTKAGKNTFERVWRLPLFDEYKEQIRSDIADIKNSGGRPAGSITGALFLEEFVNKRPWAHLDIAGTAYLSKEKRYHARHATGVGVRLLINFLENL